jgi:Family of unknown function (DUF6941)
MLYDVPAMPITGGPYLQCASLCEKALQEKDGVISVIRAVDRWTVSGPAEEMPADTKIQATLVVMFKSGIHRGPGRVTITPVTPSDRRMAPMDVPVHFEGDEDRGINIIVPMAFPVEEAGLYWFEIVLDGQVVSHIPMRVIYHRIAAQPTAPPDPNQNRR